MPLHYLRHTCATLRLRAGEPVHIVSKLLRHSSVKMTLDTYAHLLDGDLEAWADHMDDILGGGETQKNRARRGNLQRDLQNGEGEEG